MAGGRPSLLHDKGQLMPRVFEYIDNHEDYDDLVPSIEGLAFFLNVARSTVNKWAVEDGEFSEAFERLKAKQAKMLVSGGLSNKMNSTITKLMLHNHGYSDKVDSVSSDGSMSPKSTTVVTTGDVESILSKI